MTTVTPQRMRELSDSGRHAVEHEMIRYSLDDMRERLADLLDEVRRGADTGSQCRDEVVSLRSDLRHTASREDLVTAIAQCRSSRGHTGLAASVDWRGIGRMIAVIIAAVSALAIAMWGAFTRPL